MAGFVELAKFQKVNYLDLEAHGFLKRIWLKIFPVVKFRLTEDLIYIDGKGVEHIVKKGFIITNTQINNQVRIVHLSFYST